MTQTNSTLPPPPYQSAIAKPDRSIDLSWADWIKQLYIRVGQAVAPTNSSLGSSGNISAYVGASGIPETTFVIANNQATPVDVTGLSFGSSVLSAEIEVQYYRSTTGAGATEYSARAKFLATKKVVANTWDLSPLGAGGDIEPVTGEPAGITLSITSAGQVQYISTNITGTASASFIHFIAKTMANP